MSQESPKLRTESQAPPTSGTLSDTSQHYGPSLVLSSLLLARLLPRPEKSSGQVTTVAKASECNGTG